MSVGDMTQPNSNNENRGEGILESGRESLKIAKNRRMNEDMPSSGICNGCNSKRGVNTMMCVDCDQPLHGRVQTKREIYDQCGQMQLSAI